MFPEPPEGAIRWCWVCRRDLTDAESAARNRTGCGPHCLEDNQ